MTSITARVILLAGALLLQLSPGLAYGQENFVQDDFQHRINLYDVNGLPIGNEAMETKGSPFFLTKWKLGLIRLADGRIFPGVPLKVDLEKQIVHYKRTDGTDIEVQPGQVMGLVIADTITGGVAVRYQFVSGFQPIDKQSETSFYLALDSGKVSLLESMRKKINQDKDEFSGETHREYTLYNDLYVFSGGKMVRIKRDAKFFLELTKDKHGEMEAYLQKNKVSFRSVDDIRQFMHYYNGLP